MISASLGLERVHARAVIERERVRLSCHPETFQAPDSMRVTAEAAATLREVDDELGLARAAFLMSDLAWLMGDPVAGYEYARQMLERAERASSDFEAATAVMFMAWCLVEGPWPVAEGIVLCDELAADERACRALSHAAGLPRGSDVHDRELTAREPTWLAREPGSRSSAPIS